MKPVFVDHAYNGEEPLTDYSRWRLREEIGGIGDHVWEYLPESAAKSKPQGNMDKYWLGIPLVCPASPSAYPVRPFHGARGVSAPSTWRNWSVASGPKALSSNCILFLQT